MTLKIKQAFYYIALPFLLLLGAIYYLLTNNKELKSLITRIKRDKKIQALEEAAQEAEDNADKSEEINRKRFADFWNRHRPGKS